MDRNRAALLDPILTRTSCRAYRSDPIPEEDLTRLLEAMRHAPSAGNSQPWRFYVVRSLDLRCALAAAAHGQEFLSEAPVVLVVCADPDRSAEEYGERGRTLYVYQDTAAAVENALVAATALGYGSCWVGAFEEEAVRAAISLPDRLRPVAMVPIGQPAGPGRARPRRPLREIVETR
ncbi:MAG: nitroreductase family protein [Candidatus Eisenbacteria bacterium]|nr:nitroreductase family protein [Candidatus Eisenbacteria bacterium]